MTRKSDRDSQYDYDLFVSYAREDTSKVNLLANALEQHGIRLWRDVVELTIGDKLSQEIHHGIMRSRYGLVFISKFSIGKIWPERELRRLMERGIEKDEKVILPVLSELSHDDFAQIYSGLSDIVTAPFSDNIDALVDAIIKAINWSTQPRAELASAELEGQPTAPIPVKDEPLEREKVIATTIETKPPGVANPRHTVFLVHGIRTQADWAVRVANTLSSTPGISLAIPIRFGFLDMVRFLIPGRLFKRKTIDSIKAKIRDELRRWPTELSVIAHSFGAYVIGRILIEEPDIRIHRLIFCGSILPENFDWRRVADAQLGLERRRELACS